MEHLGFVSLPVIQQYLRFAESEGLNIEIALAAAKLSESEIQSEQIRVTGEQLQTLLIQLLKQAQDPLFGLKSGLQVQPGSYSALGYIAMSCASLGDAMAKIAPYEKLVGDMGVTTLERDNDKTLIVWQCNFSQQEVRYQMIDNVLLSWFKFAQWLANISYGPLEVWLERPAPSPEIQAEYETFFQSRIRFEQPKNCLVLDDDYLNLPLRQPDNALLKTLEAHANSQLVSLPETDTRFSIKVKELIRKQLKLGETGKDWVAEQLSMNSRTMQRQLQQEQVSYQKLLDEVRQSMAKELLINSTLSVQQIAEALVFAEPRSFHRSFKNWTGQSPNDFRQQQVKK